MTTFTYPDVQVMVVTGETGCRPVLNVGSTTSVYADDDLEFNLDALLVQLREQVTPKWYQFGLTAGVKEEVLDNFAKNCTPDNCIVEMLDHWLRNYKEKPTWRRVINILKAINLQQLAVDIEQVYITGTDSYLRDNPDPFNIWRLEQPPPPPKQNIKDL